MNSLLCFDDPRTRNQGVSPHACGNSCVLVDEGGFGLQPLVGDLCDVCVGVLFFFFFGFGAQV